MKKIPSALSLGIRRGNLEIRQFARQRESVVFTLLFPVILLAIFGSVFKDTIAPGVTFSQYFLAGMIASGLVNTGFQALAITIPLERDFGALKRLRGTPMPASSYFIGKAILIFVSMVIQILLLLGFGILFFGVELPTDINKWITFTWLVLLGSACSTALGIAFSIVPKSGRGASAVVSPIVIILQFFSGVIFALAFATDVVEAAPATGMHRRSARSMAKTFLISIPLKLSNTKEDSNCQPHQKNDNGSTSFPALCNLLASK